MTHTRTMSDLWTYRDIDSCANTDITGFSVPNLAIGIAVLDGVGDEVVEHTLRALGVPFAHEAASVRVHNDRRAVPSGGPRHSADAAAGGL